MLASPRGKALGLHPGIGGSIPSASTKGDIMSAMNGLPNKPCRWFVNVASIPAFTVKVPVAYQPIHNALWATCGK